MASGVVSSPVQTEDSNDEMKKKISEQEQEWMGCVFLYCILSMVFGMFWLIMKRSESEIQQNKEDFGKSSRSRIGHVFSFAIYLFGIIGLIMKSPNNVIRKIASGADREDTEKDYGVIHSTGFSAFVCCSSLFLGGISVWLVNDVTGMVLKYNTKEDLDHLVGAYLYTAPYSLAFTAFLCMAIVCGFRTFYLIKSSPQTASASASG